MGIQVNHTTASDTDPTNLINTTEAEFVGKHDITITEFDTTVEPEIAAGSVVEVGGTLYEFTSDESIGGAPSDGTVYIKLIPDTSSVVSATADTTAGSAVVTMDDTTGISVGDFVSGITVNGGTKVQSVDSGIQITLDANAHTTATDTTLTFKTGEISAEFTNTAPTWSDAKQGYYGTAGSAGHRYVEFSMVKATTAYSNKGRLQNYPANGLYHAAISKVSVEMSISIDNLVDGVVTKLPFNTVDVDFRGEFDPTTNYDFTAIDYGFYYVSATAVLNSNSGTVTQMSLYIYKNGSAEKAYIDRTTGYSSGYYLTGNVYGLIELSPGDTLDVRAKGVGGTIDVGPILETKGTSFNIIKVV